MDIVRKDNYRAIQFMNIDTKMLNVFKSNPAIYKKDNIHNQRGLILGIQGGFDIQKSIKVIHHFNRIKEKNHMIISIKAEKAFYQIQHSFMTKTFGKLGLERNFLNLIKNMQGKKPWLT